MSTDTPDLTAPTADNVRNMVGYLHRNANAAAGTLLWNLWDAYRELQVKLDARDAADALKHKPVMRFAAGGEQNTATGVRSRTAGILAAIDRRAHNRNAVLGVNTDDEPLRCQSEYEISGIGAIIQCDLITGHEFPQHTHTQLASGRELLWRDTEAYGYVRDQCPSRYKTPAGKVVRCNFTAGGHDTHTTNGGSAKAPTWHTNVQYRD